MPRHLTQRVNELYRLAGKEKTTDLSKQTTAFYEEVTKMARDSEREIEALRDQGNKDQADRVAEATQTRLADAFDTERAITNNQLKEATDRQAELDKMSAAQKFKLHLEDLPTDYKARITELKGHLDDLADRQRTVNELFRKQSEEAVHAGQTGLSAAELAKKAAEEAAKAARLAAQAGAERLKFRDEMVKKFLQGVAEENAQLQLQATLGEKLASDMAREAARAAKERAQVEAATQAGIREEASSTFEQYTQDEQFKVQLAQESQSEMIANLKAHLAEREAEIQQSFATEAAMYEAGTKDRIDVDNKAAKEAADYQREQNRLTFDQMNLGVQGAMNEMVRKSMDTAGQMREIFTSTINGINDQLVNAMTGKRTDWKSTFSGLAGQVARAGLTTAEGRLMQGVGKIDGSTRQQAIWTRSADNATKTGTDIASAITGSPDHSTSKDSSSGGVVSGIFSSIVSALIPHASGGVVNPGHAYLVGERGPEPFFPGVSGTMATNAALRNMGGHVQHGPIYVDARGANDPAAVHAAVHRAMRSYIPAAVGASAAFQEDQKRRKPMILGSGSTG